LNEDFNMKRITRTVHGSDSRVWLDQFGHWTHDEELAFEFDDAEAAKRLKRIPHAEAIDPKPRNQQGEER
jgi:hypothetical protein